MLSVPPRRITIHNHDTPALISSEPSHHFEAASDPRQVESGAYAVKAKGG